MAYDFEGDSKGSEASSSTASTVQLQIFQINKNKTERPKTNVIVC